MEDYSKYKSKEKMGDTLQFWLVSGFVRAYEMFVGYA